MQMEKIIATSDLIKSIMSIIENMPDGIEIFRQVLKNSVKLQELKNKRRIIKNSIR